MNDFFHQRAEWRASGLLPTADENTRFTGPLANKYFPGNFDLRNVSSQAKSSGGLRGSWNGYH